MSGRGWGVVRGRGGEHGFAAGNGRGSERAGPAAWPGPRPCNGLWVPLNCESVREGWSEFLCRYQWHAFATLTYSVSVWAHEKAVRDCRRWLFAWQVAEAKERGLCTSEVKPRLDGYGRQVGEHERLHGRWWTQYREGRARPVWVVGVERHESGSLHFHALLRWSDKLPDLNRSRGWSLWTLPVSRGGLCFGRFARIEPPRGQDDVTSYVSKYVVKGGEIVLSPSFDAARLVPVIPRAS